MFGHAELNCCRTLLMIFCEQTRPSADRISIMSYNGLEFPSFALIDREIRVYTSHVLVSESELKLLLCLLLYGEAI